MVLPAVTPTVAPASSLSDVIPSSLAEHEPLTVVKGRWTEVSPEISVASQGPSGVADKNIYFARLESGETLGSL